MYGPNPGLLALTIGGTDGFTFHLDRDRPVRDTFGPLACSGNSECPFGASMDMRVPDPWLKLERRADTFTGYICFSMSAWNSGSSCSSRQCSP
jgi:hypothetical protein